MFCEGLLNKNEGRLAIWFFLAALGFHGWAVSVGWTSLNLPGGEFRQAQTAITALFVQRENNYSLAYPTPVLGKPWSVPMEFPLYQWSVAKLSSLTGWPLTQTGRGINLACFYLTLPALYLLLARVGVPPARRWLMLSFLLTCPLYVIYGRAFLIETMALMFSVWFLLAYLRAVEQRRLSWLILAVIFGVGAGLVKVTTFLYLLLPAFVWSVVLLWRNRPGRPGGGWVPMLQLTVWGVGAVILPCAASVWWIHQADAIKLLNPVGAFLSSDNLTGYNFGVGQRFASEIWAQHWAIWRIELMPAGTLALLAGLAVFFLRRQVGLVLALLGLFLVVQLVFPVLYAFHEYYYVANGFTLLLAAGAVIGELFDSRTPRWVIWLLIVMIQSLQAQATWQAHYYDQKSWSFGGTPLTESLKALTEPEDVIVVAGADWNSMIPYYAQRRALMFPSGRESEPAFVDRAFRQLEGERITALVLHEPQDKNRALIDAAVAAFALYPRPVFAWQGHTVYLRRDIRLQSIAAIKSVRDGDRLELAPESVADLGALAAHEVMMADLSPRQQRAFAAMNPRPWKVYTTYGMDLIEESGRKLFTAHPDTKLWFRVPPGRRRILVQGYISPAAYADTLSASDATDGVEFDVSLQRSDGSLVEVGRHWLEPRTKPDDRGFHEWTWEVEVAADSDVLIQTKPGPQKNYGRDWSFLGRIDIR